MAILRRIPNDGTFEQLKPLRFVKGFSEVFSFDLKSATDRWPAMVIFQLVSALLDVYTASAVVNGCLRVSPTVLTPPLVRCERAIYFSVGQPLGYYGSWPLFSLSHHVVVWMAAERVYPGVRRFKAYAILGDDIVIADSRVAEEYRKILAGLEVSISESKSLISKSGAFEFAKPFFMLEGRVDASASDVTHNSRVSIPS